MKKSLYIIVSDKDEYTLFEEKENAINAMYNYCEFYNAILYPPEPGWSLDRLFNNDRDKILEYLYTLTLSELNEVFESYYSIHYADIAD